MIPDREVRDAAIIDAITDALLYGELHLGPWEEDESLALSLQVGPHRFMTGSDSIETLAADIEHLVDLAKDPKIVTVSELNREA